MWAACCDAFELRSVYTTALEKLPALEAPHLQGDARTAPARTASGGSSPGSSPAKPTKQLSSAESDFEAAARIVEKDLLRTFPTHPCFDAPQAPLIAPLRRVLLAFAWHHPSTSYCQARHQPRTQIPSTALSVSMACSRRKLSASRA